MDLKEKGARYVERRRNEKKGRLINHAVKKEKNSKEKGDRELPTGERKPRTWLHSVLIVRGNF